MLDDWSRGTKVSPHYSRMSPAYSCLSDKLFRCETDFTQSLSDLLREPAVSAGFGIMYRHSIVRAELNFGMPIAAHKGDGVRKGLQVGLGLHFL